MKRSYLLPVLVVMLALAGLAVWIARNTYWAEVQVPQPLQGEAATNPTYGAQKLVALLGGQAQRLRLASERSAQPGVLVLAHFEWSLIDRRRSDLQRWVQQGGHLVVDDSTASDAQFETWSGISKEFPKAKRPTDTAADDADASAEATAGQPMAPAGPRRRDTCGQYTVSPPVQFLRTLWLCDLHGFGWLASSSPVLWSLRNDNGYQALRVAVGRGTVTRVKGEVFGSRELLRADNGLLFAYVAQLHRGQRVSFLAQTQAPPLAALIWHFAAPVVLLVALALLLWLWRGAVRFGPLSAATDPARRSLAEQIRGTANFALRFGAGRSLRIAAQRALFEAARQRIVGFAHLPADSQAAALSMASGLEPQVLSNALAERDRSGHELIDDLTSLVLVRRALLNLRT